METMKVTMKDGKEMEISMEDAKNISKKYWKNSDERHETIKEFVEEYHERSQRNIRDVAEMDSCPKTETEVKRAIEKVLKHGSDKDIAEIIYEAIEYKISDFQLETMDM